jgi:glyoxylase-like metal-dependent hydrolase (beta-lactamase superfamily II)
MRSEGQSADDYEVVIVRYGTYETVRSDVFLSYQFYGDADGPITLDYFFWVIRGRGRTFIVDIGFSPEGGRTRHRTMLLDPMEALRTLGIDAQAENEVIVTHGHYDHIGNLSGLPNSRLLMSRREYDFWTSEMAGKELFRRVAEQREIDQLRAALAEQRLRFVEHGHSPAPGITLLELGGHTPGQLVVVVETADGPVLLTSDAVHFYEELERDMPFIAVTDLPQMYKGFETIRQLLAARPHHLVTGHDPDTLRRFPALPGPLADHAAVIGRSWTDALKGQS